MLIETLNPITNERFECTEEEFKVLNEIKSDLSKFGILIWNKELSLLVKMITKARNAATKAVIEAFVETR